MSVHSIRETYLGFAVVQVISTVLVYVLVEPFGLWGALVVSALNQVGFYLASLVAIRRGGDSFRFVLPYCCAWRWLVAVSIGVAAGLAVDQGLAQLGFGGDLMRPVELLGGCLVAATGAGVCLVGALPLRVPESHQLVAAVQ